MADTILKKWNGSTWEELNPQTTHTQIVASGTPSSSTYLRGDGTWATVEAGGGDVETVNSISPDVNGNVQLTASDVGAVAKAGDTMTGNLRIESASFASLTLDREGATGSGSVVQFENNNGIIGGIGAFGDDGLQFRTKDGTQMVIDASNNVGIGTTSPTGKLNIVDTSTRGLEFEEITGGIMRMLAYDRTNSTYETLRINGSDLEFRVGTTTSMVVNSSGNVGIGTESPSAKLQVAGTIKADALDVDGYVVDAGSGVFTFDGDTIWHAGNFNPSNYYLASNPSGYQTAAQVSTAISNLVASAPSTLDTLNELAAALGDDPNFATTVSTNIGTKVSKSGDTMSGQLSITSPGTIGNTPDIAQAGLLVDGTLGFDGNQIFFSGGGYINTGGDLALGGGGTGTQSDIYINASHNVGIGTTSPSSKLFVNGNTIIQGTGDALVVKGTTTGGININPWGTNTNIDPNDANGTIYFGRDSALANLIVQSGNVGIGTTSPSEKLQVDGAGIFDGNAASRVLYLRGNGNIVQFQGAANQNVWEVVGREENFYIYNNDLSKFSLYIDDGTNRIGINGNASPSHELDVYGEIRSYVSSTSAASKLWSRNGSSGQASLELQNSEGHFRTITDGGSYYIYDQTDGANRFHINTSGNVGIGNSSPGYKLDVAGNIHGTQLYADDYIYHTGDTNTYIRFVGGDDMQLVAGGRQMLRMDEGTDPDRLRFVNDSNWTDSSGNWNMSGNVRVQGSIYDVATNFARIIKPNGGYYTNGSSSVTGAIGITLPNGTQATYTMMSFWVDIYDYAGGTDGESWTLHCGGYTNDGNSWYNEFANLISGRTDRFFNVRFNYNTTSGHSDGQTIYIGESSSNWAYPKVIVRDIMVGHSGGDAAAWYNNPFVVTIGSITGTNHGTKTAENVASYSLDSDKLDGLHESTFMRRSANSQLDMNNNDIVGVDQIIHEGDTNTYIQFHASDQWRVVTGGSERLEVNNSETKVSQNFRVTGNRAYFQTADTIAYFGHPSTNNEAEIRIDTSQGGSSQISFTDHGDMSWAIGGDDADNSFKIHGSATATVPTINSLAVPIFELTTGGQAYVNGDEVWDKGNLTFALSGSQLTITTS